MTPGVQVTKNNVKRVLAGLREVPTNDVLVGIPDDDGEREGTAAGSAVRRDVGGKAQDITNPALGIIHEFGAPEVNIPARPFLIPGVREGRAAYTKYLMQAARAYMAGKKDVAERALHAAGMAAMSAVQTKLKTGPFEPLKPATIAARRRRSPGSTYRRKATGAADVKPLIDTAQMLRAVTYVIRKGGGA